MTTTNQTSVQKQSSLFFGLDVTDNKNCLFVPFFCLLTLLCFFTVPVKSAEQTDSNYQGPDPIEWAKASLAWCQNEIKKNPDFLDQEKDLYRRIIKAAQESWLAGHGWKVRTHTWREKTYIDKGYYIKEGLELSSIKTTSCTVLVDRGGKPKTNGVLEKWKTKQKDPFNASGYGSLSKESLVYIQGAPAELLDSFAFDRNCEIVRVLDEKKEDISRSYFAPNAGGKNYEINSPEEAEALRRCQAQRRALHISYLGGHRDSAPNSYASLRLSPASRYGTFFMKSKSKSGGAKDKLLAEAESLQAYVASYVDLADAYLRKQLGLPDATLNKDEDQVGLSIELIASAKDCEDDQGRQHCLDFTPQRVTITGTVKNDAGELLRHAKVQLRDPAATVTTDTNGHFTLIANIPDGDEAKVWNTSMNFTLTRIIDGLNFTLEVPHEPLIANGKNQPIILTVTDNQGKPLENRQLTASLPEKWTGPNNRNVDYLKFPPGFNQYVQTDKQGKIRLDFVSPAVLTAKVGTLVGKQHMDRIMFPVTGTLSLQDNKNGARCEKSYNLESPYPDVSKFRIVDVDAGTWQKKGSTLVITDRDSDRFVVTIKMFGRLKLAGGEIYRNSLYHELAGKELTFYYQPFMIGDDLNDQPGNLWEQFALFNLQLAGKYMIDIGGSYMLKGVNATASLDAAKLYDSGKKLWGAVETTDKIDTLATDIQHRPKGDLTRAESEQKTIQIADTVMGCVEAVPGLADIALTNGKTFGEIALGVSKYNLPVEVGKVVLENAKLMLKFHQQFEAINNAYQETILIPVVVTVQDPDGHKISILRNVSVRAWQK